LHEPYRKDMSHVSWAEVYERQRLRAPLSAGWLDGLGLQPGDRVLDIGSGPGFVSVEAARRVGPEGLVYAVDRSAAALAYLEQLEAEQGLPQIRRIVADAADPFPLDGAVNAALVTMMLHHAEAPGRLLRNVAGLLPAGARVVVAEFHPDCDCAVGPPRAHRIPPEQAEAWCREAGLVPLSYQRQTEEHYMLLLERS
jgi:ubiquinone/menaquinone biosynthesis C-methylase UbiE